jgi:hypothetical protein
MSSSAIRDPLARGDPAGHPGLDVNGFTRDP